MFGVLIKKWICSVMLAVFGLTSVTPLSFAQSALSLPAPGQMVALSPAFNPPILRGIKVFPDNPFRFDFILDKGDDKSTEDQIKRDSTRLIKYFLASLTIPEKDLWVNLSPYEKDRIIPDAFGRTEMGRDLLAQDYLLKQITASLLYPEGETGKAFWRKVYALAQEKYGTTDIPVDTFNKVWIVPEKASVYENAKVGAVYITDSRLKVMLETDYLAVEVARRGAPTGRPAPGEAAPRPYSESFPSSDIAKSVLRDIVIPVLEREVNEGQNFASLRQVYQSLILAAWYKKKIKGSLLSAVYVDRNKTDGVSIADPNEAEKIWGQYVEAFRKGAYNFIREEASNPLDEVGLRKYFSGGAHMSVGDILASDELFVVDNGMAGSFVQVDVQLLGIVGQEGRISVSRSNKVTIGYREIVVKGKDSNWKKIMNARIAKLARRYEAVMIATLGRKTGGGIQDRLAEKYYRKTVAFYLNEALQHGVVNAIDGYLQWVEKDISSRVDYPLTLSFEMGLEDSNFVVRLHNNGVLLEEAGTFSQKGYSQDLGRLRFWGKGVAILNTRALIQADIPGSDIFLYDNPDRDGVVLEIRLSLSGIGNRFQIVDANSSRFSDAAQDIQEDSDSLLSKLRSRNKEDREIVMNTTWQGRYVDMIQLIEMPEFQSLLAQKGVSIHSDSDFLILDVGVGAMTFGLNEVYEAVSRINSNVKLVGTELPGVIPDVHIVINDQQEIAQIKQYFLARHPGAGRLPLHELAEIRFVVHGTKLVQIVAGFRNNAGKWLYTTVAVAPGVSVLVKGERKEGEIYKALNFFSFMVSRYLDDSVDVSGILARLLKEKQRVFLTQEGVSMQVIVDPFKNSLVNPQMMAVIETDNPFRDGITQAGIILVGNVTMHMPRHDVDGFITNVGKSLRDGGILIEKNQRTIYDMFGNQVPINLLNLYQNHQGQMKYVGSMTSSGDPVSLHDNWVSQGYLGLFDRESYAMSPGSIHNPFTGDSDGRGSLRAFSNGFVPGDYAQTGNQGGVDLTKDKLTIDVHSGGEIRFHFDQAVLNKINMAQGFVPVTIRIRSLENLKVFLGFSPLINN